MGFNHVKDGHYLVVFSGVDGLDHHVHECDVPIKQRDHSEMEGACGESFGRLTSSGW